MTAAETPTRNCEHTSLFAEPEQRREGRLKLTGRARYTADLQLPGTLSAAFLTSPVPHARVVSVDASAAKAVSGVCAVLTGEDVRGAYQGRRLQDWPVLAWDRVRFVGDRVAAVAAETREAAEEAVALIRVKYEELPAVLDAREALREKAPVLHPDAKGYAFLAGERPPVPHPNLHGHNVVEKGTRHELEEAFTRAHQIFEHTFETPRHHQGYIEPHAALVWIDGNGRVRVASTNKHPFLLRTQLAAALGVAPEEVVVEAPFIGGDFGGKGAPLDEAACCFLARATMRPVRAVMDYSEELMRANPRPAATMRLRTGVDHRGRFLAHEADIVFDGGAYAAGSPLDTLIPDVPHSTGGLSALPAYSIPHARTTFSSVYTNTVPGGHMRGPGEVQVRFAGESHVDIIAGELGLDPLEFRLLNAVRQGDTGPGNERSRESRAVEVLEVLRQTSEWRQNPLPPNRGRGIALGAREMHGGVCSAVARLIEGGRVEVLTAQPDQGCGSHEAITRIAATVLSIDPKLVVVRQGDTDTAPFDMGSAASRVTWVAGLAVQKAAAQLKERLEDYVPHALGWISNRVTLSDNRFLNHDSGEDLPFQEGAASVLELHGEIETEGVHNTGQHGTDEPTDYSFSGYMIEVEVDPETGETIVVDATLFADVGTIVNPVAHQGQLEGGFAMGLGAALTEDLTVRSGKVTACDLHRYRLPTQADVPPLRTVLLSTSGPGPFGVKSVGELSNSGVAPAVANAVADAVGARVTTLPITAERIFWALRERAETNEKEG